MNEIAKQMWDTATEHLQAAANASDIAESNAYVGIGELALHAAEFAVNYPELVLGLDEIPQPNAGTPLPPGPTTGPRLWGAPNAT